jgi:uncharacterized membrane protein YfcA
VTLEALGPAQLAFVAAVMLAAGLVHGSLGFGFPLIATPLVALVIDVKTAILLVAPVTLVVTALSVVRGGGAREALARFWILPLTMAAGVYAGTRLLIVAKPEPFLLVLAVLILVYLGLDRLRRGESAFVRRWRLPFGAIAGLAGGVFEATANVAVPPLIIYLSLLGLGPAALVQTLNFCFSVGKSVQVATWAVHGNVAITLWVAAAAFTVPSVAALYAGMRVRDRIDAPTYRKWLRGALWVMALLLGGQYLYLEVLAAPG